MVHRKKAIVEAKIQRKDTRYRIPYLHIQGYFLLFILQLRTDAAVFNLFLILFIFLFSFFFFWGGPFQEFHMGIAIQILLNLYMYMYEHKIFNMKPSDDVPHMVSIYDGVYFPRVSEILSS